MSQPNIVFLVADDHQSRAMHWTGCQGVHTPNLDRLAAGGTAFTRAYHQGGFDNAVCIPTRASLLTGMNNFKALRGGRDVINPDLVTLPEHFKKAGYYSFITGKWHNDIPSLTRSFDGGSAIFLGGMHDHYTTPVHPFDPSGTFPLDQVQKSPCFATDLFCDTASRFIDNYSKEEPFFLYAAFTAPHDPRTPPEGIQSMYSVKDIELPSNFAANHPYDLGVDSIRDECLAPYPRTADRIRREIADYYGMITAMDAGIGRILTALEASGRMEDTIIVYTADHGLAVGQHGLLGKQNVYEHSARVPLILSGSGIPFGQVSHALCYSWDSFPTLCELCAIDPVEGLDARSLSTVLKSINTTHRDHITTHYMGNQRMITDGRWKLIYTRVKNEERKGLYDLQNDPDETNNRIHDALYSEHVERLTEKMKASPAGFPSSSGPPD